MHATRYANERHYRGSSLPAERTRTLHERVRTSNYPSGAATDPLKPSCPFASARSLSLGLSHARQSRGPVSLVKVLSKKTEPKISPAAQNCVSFLIAERTNVKAFARVVSASPETRVTIQLSKA